MLVEIYGKNVPEAFHESLWKIRLNAHREESRNGPVWAMPYPTFLSIARPWERVLTCPQRDANPFFHAMEFIWMMSGSNDVNWIAQFNRRMKEYSDDGTTQHAAYGYRWRRAFGFDQVYTAIQMLKRNRDDRRIVLGMWKPRDDLGYLGKDVPCNTQIMLRVIERKLNFLVTNRSNDLIWGMLGANAVHMTMLQELIAQSAGLELGRYEVISNNLHIYESVPKFDYYFRGVPERSDVYNFGVALVPLLQSNENYEMFVNDCEDLVGTKLSIPRTFWMRWVGLPIYKAWFERTPENLSEIVAEDWRTACVEWATRRAALGNQPRDNQPCVSSGQQESVRVDSGFVQPDTVAGVDSTQCDMGSSTTESSSQCDVSSQPSQVAE